MFKGVKHLTKLKMMIANYSNHINSVSLVYICSIYLECFSCIFETFSVRVDVCVFTI